MSESKEVRPIILSLVDTGTPDYPRYMIADQYLRYWAEGAWTEQNDTKKAALYVDAEAAITEINRLLMVEYGGKRLYRFKASVYIDLHTDNPIEIKELQLWLMRVSKLVMDAPRFGNGPVAGSLGLCHINWDELTELKDEN